MLIHLIIHVLKKNNHVIYFFFYIFASHILTKKAMYMKLSNVMVFFLIVSLLFVSSCGSNRDQARKNYFKELNKQNSQEYNLLTSNNVIKGDNDQSPTHQKSKQEVYNESSEQAYKNNINAKAEEFKLQYDDSELANGDIYREAATHRASLMKQANSDCNCGTDAKKTKKQPTLSTKPSTTAKETAPQKVVEAPQKTTSSNSENEEKQQYFAHLLNADFEPMRRVDVTLVNESDGSLFKDYSVVIAALSRLDGVERLKQVFANSEDKVFFVKNNLGIYYAIMGSYDTRAEANRRISQIRMNYNSQYPESQLIKKYGIPFTNLWVLQK